MIDILDWLPGMLLGLLAENLGEWFMHRFVLHGLGKRKASIWAYHWHEHHRAAHRFDMIDPVYRQCPKRWNTLAKELLVLGGAILAHLPLLPYVPAYVTGMYAGLALYFYRHRKAHLNPGWARKHLPWHYDHHMRASDANWCITWPWFDWLLGTRVIPRATARAKKKPAGRASGRLDA